MRTFLSRKDGHNYFERYYLKSIGVSTFGWRHKIWNQFASDNSQNIVKTMIASPSIFEYSCNNCDDTFPSLDNLNAHNGTKHKPRESCYEGGNLYDDMEIHVMTMTMEEENQPAESTRIRIDSTEDMVTVFPCNIFGFECGSDTFLLVHNRSHHGEGARQFNCTDCAIVGMLKYGNIDFMINLYLLSIPRLTLVYY